MEEQTNESTDRTISDSNKGASIFDSRNSEGASDDLTLGEIEEEEMWREHTRERMSGRTNDAFDETGCIVSRPEDFGRKGAPVLESSRPQLWSSAAEGIGREGIVTVWDEQGRYVGCMGVELWRWLLTPEADRGI